MKVWLRVRLHEISTLAPERHEPSLRHCPQGSILGPLLFMIYMNDLPKLSLTSNILLFADDTVLYYSDKCVKTLYNTVQRDLDMVINWCSFNKLCINSNKTKATFFGKSFSRSYDRNRSLFIHQWRGYKTCRTS